jgi:hypothetical protein
MWVCAPLYATKASKTLPGTVLDALPYCRLALFRDCLLADFQSLCMAHDIGRKGLKDAFVSSITGPGGGFRFRPNPAAVGWGALASRAISRTGF